MMAEAPTDAAPPLQPFQAREVSDAEVIHWLNEHLSDYARSNRELREELAAANRQLEIYRTLIASFDRQQKGDGK